jgi:hypothetical protein
VGLEHAFASPGNPGAMQASAPLLRDPVHSAH